MITNYLLLITLLLLFWLMMTEPQAKASVHIEEVPKDLEEQVEELHAQVKRASFDYFFLTVHAKPVTL
mgnify:FL=1